ncbi:hypothetical protein ACFYO2_36975 [Streptomyces sp. NPDC006602]
MESPKISAKSMVGIMQNPCSRRSVVIGWQQKGLRVERRTFR